MCIEQESLAALNTIYKNWYIGHNPHSTFNKYHISINQSITQQTFCGVPLK